MTVTEVTKAVELKPCPFCGSKGMIAATLDDQYRPMCRTDGCAALDGYNKRADAIEAWNTRTQSAAQADFAGLRDKIAADLSQAEPFWTAGCLADALIKQGVFTPTAAQNVPVASPALMDLATASLFEARNALKQHWMDWDGEPEDGWALRLAWAKCDQTLSILAENSFDEVSPAIVTDTPSESEESYRIGLDEGRQEMVREIDLETGGDGEFRWSTEPDRHCPDAETMKARVLVRYHATTSRALIEALRETNAALERDGDPAFAHLILANKAAIAQAQEPE